MQTFVSARRKTLNAILIAAVAAVTISIAPPAEAASRHESAILNYMNKARKAKGLRPLALSSSVSNVARAHSAQMIKARRLYHTRDLRAALDNWTWWRVAGENVGRGPSVYSLHRAFMQSSSHRANILYRSYRVVGIGLYWVNGTAYVTVMFLG